MGSEILVRVPEAWFLTVRQIDIAAGLTSTCATACSSWQLQAGGPTGGGQSRAGHGPSGRNLGSDGPEEGWSERKSKARASGGDLALCEPLTPAHLGEALGKNPGYIKLRKIRAAQNISKTVSMGAWQHSCSCLSESSQLKHTEVRKLEFCLVRSYSDWHL